MEHFLATLEAFTRGDEPAGCLVSAVVLATGGTVDGVDLVVEKHANIAPHESNKSDEGQGPKKHQFTRVARGPTFAEDEHEGKQRDQKQGVWEKSFPKSYLRSIFAMLQVLFSG